MINSYMNFNSFYFDNSVPVPSQQKLLSVNIDEGIYDRLIDALNKDYRLVIECEEVKDDYGYGYKYMLSDGNSIMCLNKYKDEVDNNEAMLFCTDEIYRMIREKYTTKEGE